ncbi:MAG: hypothetical protein OQL28_14360 [Sedimenticola sp.]|nr:hypothetical protein [Sedimenticola sp.]
MKEYPSPAVPVDGTNPSVYQKQQPTLDRKGDVLIYAIIWGLVGAIFGGLYVGFTGMLAPLDMGGLAVVPAAALAGAVGAAFYGSFQVAIIGTLAGAVSGIAYQVVADSLHAGELTLVSLLAGMVAGYLYGYRHEAVSGALMKALTGLLAGTLSGSVAWLLTRTGLPLNGFASAALLVPVTGTFYIYGVYRLVSRMDCRIPLPLVGSLVAGVLSVLVAGSIWTVHDAVTQGYLHPASSPTGVLQVMGAILGGALGGLLTGGLYARLGLSWLHRH